MSAAPSMTPADALASLLRTLKLPAFARYAAEVAHKAEREGWTFGRYLQHLVQDPLSSSRVQAA